MSTTAQIVAKASSVTSKEKAESFPF